MVANKVPVGVPWQWKKGDVILACSMPTVVKGLWGYFAATFMHLHNREWGSENVRLNQSCEGIWIISQEREERDKYICEKRSTNSLLFYKTEAGFFNKLCLKQILTSCYMWIMKALICNLIPVLNSLDCYCYHHPSWSASSIALNLCLLNWKVCLGHLWAFI